MTLPFRILALGLCLSQMPLQAELLVVDLRIFGMD